MAAGEFNIIADQGANYVLYFLYQNNAGVAIDIATYTGRMQIRRSVHSDSILLGATGDMHSGTLLGGGSTGTYSGTDGVLGTGGILLNASSGGLTGASGVTGGVYVSFDATTMQNCPHGRHVYDCELVSGSTVTKALNGRFEVRAEVTR
jgi:hypothetical protein